MKKNSLLLVFLKHDIEDIEKEKEVKELKNPCGNYSGIQSNPIASKSSGGKLTQVIGKRGTVKKFITGK
jgi:hypothetical protein